MTLVIRSEPPPTATTLVIHMGAGAMDSVLNAAIRNYGEYRGHTAYAGGIFAVSVFAVTDGVTEDEILRALPQRSFARASVGVVTSAAFELLPTSLYDGDLDPAVAVIQRVHYDIVLPALDDPRLAELDPLDDQDLEVVARQHLVPHVERLLGLFGPRLHK